MKTIYLVTVGSFVEQELKIKMQKQIWGQQHLHTDGFNQLYSKPETIFLFFPLF